MINESTNPGAEGQLDKSETAPGPVMKEPAPPTTPTALIKVDENSPAAAVSPTLIDAEPPAPSKVSKDASLTPAQRVIPTWTDPTVRRAADAIGGPLGRHALIGRTPILTPLRVALLMALLFLIFAWLAKSPCIQQTEGTGGMMVLDSSGNRQWISGCYNDVVPTYQIQGLADGVFPYAPRYNTAGALIEPLAYPVLIGAFMWLVAQVSNGYSAFAESTGVLPQSLDVAVYFTVGAIVLSLLYLWAVASTLKISRRRPWDVAIMCLSPLLVVHAFSNWDIIPVALLAASMLSWSRSRPVIAGILLGLAVAAKLYPVLLLFVLLLLCLRSGKMRAFTVTAVAAVLAWAAVNLPVALAYPDAWRAFFVANTNRKSEFTTWYAIYSDWSGFKIFDPELAAGQAPELLNVVSLLLFLLACIGIGWLAMAAKRRPRVAQLMFLIVAAFLLTNKVWNPQFSLWLLPLVVLAIPRWRLVLVWQLAEAGLWFLLMLTYATKGSEPGRFVLLSQYPYQNMAIVRDLLVISLMALVIRDIIKPELDLIRQAGDDDPTGGVLAAAADVLTVPTLRSLIKGRKSVPTTNETAENEPVETPRSGSESERVNLIKQS